MRRILFEAARAALGITVGLIVMAALRLAPVAAEPLVDVRVLPLAGPAVLLAILTALCAGERCPSRLVRPLVIATALVALALLAAVLTRGPSGLAAEVRDGERFVAFLPAGALDVAGPDLRDLPSLRRTVMRWQGRLRAPLAGGYRFWVEGRGAVEVWLDGALVVQGAGEPLHAGGDLALEPGEHELRVRLERVGRGARLRLGWTRPDHRAETIPARFLGPPLPNLRWRIGDLLACLLALLAGALVWLLPWWRPLPLPTPQPVGRREIVVSLLGHTVLALLMSWPLVLDLAGASVMDRPDGRLNAWIMAWDVHALAHAPSRLFAAPIFHPLPDALAFSENLLLPALLTAPAQWLGGPILAYNLVLLLSLVVSGLGVQLLVRRVSGDRGAAFVAGVMFACGAHRWIRLAHLHAQVTLFLPFALLALERFWQQRTLRRAALVGLCVGLQGLSSVYLGAITATTIAVAVGLAFLGGLRGAAFVRLLLGLGVAVPLLAPVIHPYLRMRAFQGMEWSLSDVALYATTLESYAASGSPWLGPLGQRYLDPSRIQDTLFPGFTLLLFGLSGLARAPRRYRAVILVASAVAIVFSLGPQTALYRFLYENVVLVRGIRALSRFSLTPVLGLCVLAGCALSGRRHWRGVVLVLFLLESSQVPIRFVPAPPVPALVAVADHAGAVAALPLGERDTEAMLAARFRPLLNGDSGFIPRPYTRAMEALTLPLDTEGLRLLRALGVREVVVREEQTLPLLARVGDESVYAVSPGPQAQAILPGREVPALWSQGGTEIDFGQVVGVDRVAFELGEAAWVAHPSVAVSDDGEQWTPVAATASLADATLALFEDPRHGRGEVRFPARRVRYLRLDPRLPARPGVLWVGAAPPPP